MQQRRYEIVREAVRAVFYVSVELVTQENAIKVKTTKPWNQVRIELQVESRMKGSKSFFQLLLYLSV